MAKVTQVYRAEYFENRLNKWISFYESTNIELVKAQIGTPIVGNPPQRLAKYNKSGVRKIRYSFVRVVE